MTQDEEVDRLRAHVAALVGAIDDARRLYLQAAEEPCECVTEEEHRPCPSCSTFARAERRLDTALRALDAAEQGDSHE